MIGKIDVPVLFVVGLPCSGKTEFTKIAQSMPLLCVEWSEFLSHELSTYAGGVDRGAKLELVEGLVRERGPHYFPKRILRHVGKQLETSVEIHRGVVLSGARNPAELRVVAEGFTRSLVVMIWSGYEARFLRCKDRDRLGDPDTIEGFVRNDFAELNGGIAKIADELAHEVVLNDGTLAEFTIQARSLLESCLLDARSFVD